VQLPHAWPIFVVLLLAGMTALYFYPEGCWLLSTAVVTLPFQHRPEPGVNLRFAVIWIVFTLILICGRFILLSWFEEPGDVTSRISD
jgi:hypothetical protein